MKHHCTGRDDCGYCEAEIAQAEEDRAFAANTVDRRLGDDYAERDFDRMGPQS